MKKIILLINILLINSCILLPPKANLNNAFDSPLPFLAMLIEDINQRASLVPVNTFALGNIPTNVNEGTEQSMTIRFAMKSDTARTVTVQSDCNCFEINGSQKIDITFTPETSTIDQTFSVSALIDGNSVDEKAKLTISSPGMDTTTLEITNKDTIGNWVSMVSDNTILEEGSKNNIKVKLSWKPFETINLDIESDYTGLVVDTKQLIFSPDNWNTEQIVGVTGAIDDNTVSENVKIKGSATGIANTLTLTYRENSIVMSIPFETLYLFNFGEPVISAYLKYKPGNDTVVNFSAPGFSISSLTFTPSNYDTVQTTLLKLISKEDVLLDTNLYFNRQSITITASGNSMENTLVKTNFLDIENNGYAVTTDSNYTDIGDGIIKDNLNNLLWQKCSMGQTGNDCSGGKYTYATWKNSISYCDNLVLGGKGNWRLPASIELRTLINTSYTPRVHSIFTSTTYPTYYWSSATNKDNTEYAWFVYYGSGANVGYSNKIGGFYVRCVSGP